jgi:hypothetical protein
VNKTNHDKPLPTTTTPSATNTHSDSAADPPEGAAGSEILKTLPALAAHIAAFKNRGLSASHALALVTNPTPALITDPTTPPVHEN